MKIHMKSIKKILAGLICSALLLSTMGVSAWAVADITDPTEDNASYYWTINGGEEHEFYITGYDETGHKTRSLELSTDYNSVISQIEGEQTPGWTSKELIFINNTGNWTVNLTHTSASESGDGYSHDKIHFEGKQVTNYRLVFYYGVEPSNTNESAASIHIHSWSHGIIFDATETTDGLEGDYCSCGVRRNTSVIPAVLCFMEKKMQQLSSAKPGSTIILEMGRMNSLPPYFMKKIASRNDCNIILKIEDNSGKYDLSIPAGSTFDTGFDWYGPDKLKELFDYPGKINF